MYKNQGKSNIPYFFEQFIRSTFTFVITYVCWIRTKTAQTSNFALTVVKHWATKRYQLSNVGSVVGHQLIYMLSNGHQLVNIVPKGGHQQVNTKLR